MFSIYTQLTITTLQSGLRSSFLHHRLRCFASNRFWTNFWGKFYFFFFYLLSELLIENYWEEVLESNILFKIAFFLQFQFHFEENLWLMSLIQALIWSHYLQRLTFNTQMFLFYIQLYHVIEICEWLLGQLSLRDFALESIFYLNYRSTCNHSFRRNDTIVEGQSKIKLFQRN